MQKYIIVTGGELRNKGAQAMTFITVDQISKKFPECKVVLISSQDYKRSENEKNNLKFDIIPSMKVLINIIVASPFQKVLKKNCIYKKYIDILKNTEALIDISGYALGSNWGANYSIGIIFRVYIAKHFKIPVYFMPQSFGPFDFRGKASLLANYMIKRYMPYVNIIYARESEGKRLLQETYGLNNVKKAYDLVLQNKGLEMSNIYHNIPTLFDMEISKGSVAVIPNSKNNKYGIESEVLALYNDIIEFLLNNNRKVYLIYHSIEDFDICQKIKVNYFFNNENVVVVDTELSCLDFDNIVNRFDFIIGSRYHSIVHSYKKAVPAIILGWAVKYRELAECFNQDKYCFDIKDISMHGNILSSVSKMCEFSMKESSIIATKLSEIQKENVYDIIRLKSEGVK